MIEDRYASESNMSVTRVICKNDVTHYGYFNSFADYSELMEKNRYRFIPRNNSKAFRNEYSKKGEYNKTFSIILNGEDILAIEFVMPIHNKVY